MSFFSKFAKLPVEVSSKKKLFAIFNNDGDNALYIKELKKEIRKYPKLKELNDRSFVTKKLSKIDLDDIVVFGDAIAPYNYDYRVVEMKDVINTDGFKTYDLVDDLDEIKRVIKAYHKANYPKEHKTLLQRSRNNYYPSRRYKKTTPSYYSIYSPSRLKDLDFELELPTQLLRKYGEIEIEVELPSKKLPKKQFTELIEYSFGKRKKVSGKKYVVHQNIVKAGLKGYNIYQNKNGEELVNISGQQYWIVRRSGRKDYLVKA